MYTLSSSENVLHPSIGVLPAQYPHGHVTALKMESYAHEPGPMKHGTTVIGLHGGSRRQQDRADQEGLAGELRAQSHAIEWLAPSGEANCKLSCADAMRYDSRRVAVSMCRMVHSPRSGTLMSK